MLQAYYTEHLQGQIGLNLPRHIPLDAIKFLQRRLMQRHTKPDKNGIY